MPYLNIEDKRRYAREWRRRDRARRDARGEDRRTYRVGHKVESAIALPDVLARLAEIPADTRSLTARLFGDPLPGRAALDHRR